MTQTVIHSSRRRDEVADVARFLLAREADAAWERELDDPRLRPKLEAFLEASAREAAEDLDPDRL